MLGLPVRPVVRVASRSHGNVTAGDEKIADDMFPRSASVATVKQVERRPRQQLFSANRSDALDNYRPGYG